MPSQRARRPLSTATALVLLLAMGAPQAAPGDMPVPVPKAQKAEDKARSRTASLPAKGLFVGDQLSASARSRLTDLILEALGLDVEVALVVPVGPWQIDGGSHADNDLTQARLATVRRFLGERGVDPKRILVESRIDAKAKEPRLEVQLVGRPSNE